MTAAGSARSLEERALRSARPPRVERVRVAAHEIELRRYPPYPGGGVNGGHVAAIARAADQLAYVSVHGYEHADVAIAMLVDLLADRWDPRPAATRIGQPVGSAGYRRRAWRWRVVQLSPHSRTLKRYRRPATIGRREPRVPS